MYSPPLEICGLHRLFARAARRILLILIGDAIAAADVVLAQQKLARGGHLAPTLKLKHCAELPSWTSAARRSDLHRQPPGSVERSRRMKHHLCHLALRSASYTTAPSQATCALGHARTGLSVRDTLALHQSPS